MKRALALICVFLAGCASVTRDECREGDWAAIGARDGAAGRVADEQLARHIRACDRVDVTPDRSAWDIGYADGLAQYCTPLSGLSEGQAGRSYRNICPAANEPAFLRGFELGRAEHRATTRIRDIQADMNRLRAENAQIIAQLQTDDAAALQAQLRSNQSEQSLLQLELFSARHELFRVQRDIRIFRAQHR